MEKTEPRSTPLIVKPPVMAAIVGLTTRRLEQLAEQGMPKAGRAGYPLAAAVRWIIAFWEKRATPTPMGDAFRRRAEAQATQAEIDLANLRAELAPVATLMKSRDEARARIRARLMMIPAAATPAIRRAKTVAEVEAVLRTTIVAALEDLSGGAAEKAASVQ